MALPATVVWECRASGASDNNGGGFVAGGSGTDYSQQNSAQLTLTDLATTGVTTTVTSVTGGFTTAMVDNIIQIVSGTNFTAGFYRVVSQVDNNTITVDRAPTTAAGVSGTGSIGGALATLATLATAMVAQNKAFCTGAFTCTASNTFAQAVTGNSSRLIGYGAARGDGLRATLTLQTNTGITGLNMTQRGWVIENWNIACGSLGTSTGLSLGQFTIVRNCKVSNFTNYGILGNNTATEIISCEVTGGTSAATAAIQPYGSASGGVSYCFIHDNACPGLVLGSGNRAVGNLIANNTGASSDGIRCADTTLLLQNTIHGNGRDGIRFAGTWVSEVWLDNLLTSNGGYGANQSSGGVPAEVTTDGNAYYNNTSGARNNLDSTTGIYGVSPYTNVRDVILAASPYVGPASGGSENFGLNNTAGGGAACRAAGIPGAFTAAGLSTTTGYLDMGAVQHADPARSSPGIIMATG